MRAAVIAAALTALVACGDDNGSTVDVESLGIQAFAAANAGGVDIEVTFTTSPSPSQVEFVAIGDNNEVAVTLGGAEIILRELFGGIEGDVVRYTGSFADLGDRALVLELRRGGQSIATSMVTIPSPFAVVDPPASHARGADMIVDWDISGEVGTTRVLLAGTCVAGSEVRIDADPGTATIPAAAFDDPAGASCNATVQVDRLAAGEASTAFGRGGRVEAAQTRTFDVAISD